MTSTNVTQGHQTRPSSTQNGRAPIFYKRIARLCIFLSIGCLAFISVIKGIDNALTGSQDFQWSPSRLFWSGANPYSFYIAGNPEGKIILKQSPNYAHALYVSLYPFSFMNWNTAKAIWAAINVSLSIISPLILCRAEGLSKSDCFFVTCIFMCSTPARTSISLGQHSIVVLFFFCSILINRKYLGSALTGLGFFKYSFMPPTAFYFLLARGVISFSYSIIFCVLGWLFFSWRLDINMFESLFQPLFVANSDVKHGAGDLMTIIEIFFQGESRFSKKFLMYFIPILLSFFIAFYHASIENKGTFALSSLLIASLLLFKHISYDYVALLPAFVLFYKYIYLYKARIGIGLILFIWFGVRFITSFNIPHTIIVPIHFMIGVGIALSLTAINHKTGSVGREL